MRVCIVGGNLQGVEAAYLGRKAGWEIVLVDRRAGVPASGLCDSFVRADVTEAASGRASCRWLRGVALIIPALEEERSLSALLRLARREEVSLAFDPEAYAVSSSKRRSNDLFLRLGIPCPRPWPDCGFPAVAKPDKASGSRGVSVLRDWDEYERKNAEAGGLQDWVVQEYVRGPLLSIEVVGTPGAYRVGQITDLCVDESHDCKRILAPSALPEESTARLQHAALTLASAVGLRGLMDVEAISSGGRMYVIEIDARLPSQTPTTVYWSTGLNLVRRLGGCFLGQDERQGPLDSPPRGVVYEHISVSPGALRVGGERLMSGGPLHLVRGFFGATEAITDYQPNRETWKATLIVTGESRAEAWERREEVIRNIRKRFRLASYSDPVPGV